MAATIRLMRFGKRGAPSYRIVVLDKRQKRDGAYIENLGIYNPMTEPATFNLKHDRFDYWKSRGAEISDGMSKLLKRRTVAPTKTA